MSSQGFDDWVRSDRFHNSFLLAPDADLDFALQNMADNGLPQIAVSAAQGKFLYLHARAIGAKRVLEVGTLGGYSAIWLARALPADGEVVTMEVDEKHATVAQASIDHAGLASKVKIVRGPAVDSLAALPSEPKFDLAFVDADKRSNLAYLLEAERLVRPGGVIIIDNVVRYGRVSNPADPEHDGIDSQGVRRMLEHLKTDKNVDATTIATVGEKGWDGFCYAIRL
ncbi:S-adenosyl-L-methionine-dependent methyltransferase [Epithele typhae]|uniref:S-adenosyl-L-methionine-dependent methyltransferase n=1 Tax=Epithele typhae TaxID=378194 RepID=UPI002007A2E3|nr:S-adenosyl-L-methionine-dependent methyltransferase [Epithele typhae]KAH9946182.1 S-adenosyl-L-methionine-dependent methyltransferase [Epithele typhae]